MVSDFASVLATTFGSSLPHPELTLIQGLKKVHPDLRVVSTTEGRDTTFPIQDYLDSQKIRTEIVQNDTHTSFEYDGAREHQKVLPLILAGIVTFEYAQYPRRALG